MRKIFMLQIAALFFYASCCFGQQQLITAQKWASIEVKQNPLLNYKPEIKYPTGCHNTLECTDMDIVFYEISLDKVMSTIKLKGRIYTDVRNSDTVGNGAVAIYLACPKKNKLKKVPNMLFSPVVMSKPHEVFPNRTGDFILEFAFKRNHRLYFGDSFHRLIEYDIGKLLTTPSN